MIKEGVMGFRNEERIMKGVKTWVNTMDFPSTIEFSRLCLMIDATIMILLWFSMYIEKIFSIINEGG